MTSETSNTEEIFVIVVFDPNPESELALHNNGYLSLVFDSVPENVDSIISSYPVEGDVTIEDGLMALTINDAASGSQIIAFSLSVGYSADRPLGQNLVPSGINYCRADAITTTEETTTEAATTEAATTEVGIAKTRKSCNA